MTEHKRWHAIVRQHTAQGYPPVSIADALGQGPLRRLLRPQVSLTKG